MRRSLRSCAGFLQNLNSGKTNFFTSLWSKPQTRDERIKEYIPEVIEESLREQRAVLQENTSRDRIVELGHRVLREIENKRPTPSIAPHLNKILQEYNCSGIIEQRPLSYLLYPCSTISSVQQPHELVANFTDNFRSFVEEVELNGCSFRVGDDRNHEQSYEEVGEAPLGSEGITGVAGGSGSEAQSTARSGPIVMASPQEHEKMDVTLFIRLVSGMALANVQNGDLKNAIRCVDVGIRHAIAPSRLGALLGMKAGILVHQRKYEEALECANKAVQVSRNIQGYIHGAFSLRALNRIEEALQLLEKGRDDHPMNTQLLALLEGAKMKTTETASEEIKRLGT
ncbi:hypothetical protein ERJ75_000778100 [Trypanosoma vivax]|uniref:Tetratricopeptide repeat protein n=1 Tax=Trypanosoma vivax (strain Y486) TaxID=1055687 RepID=G0U3E1_TRYVY|nr:hypothetical protein TRVL_00517 [Trypanosoma vivax]KAH8613560.1 hypothetical protein ERJ75_000778100 [Trypanosoma vivax]CCC50798.1 conserved hypothetical protein [Trypanosoma vivax Y486]